MKTHCTRIGCPRPTNVFADLDNRKTLKRVQQKYCTACGMPQILAGRYLPLKLLGRGGFGAAFLATDRYTPKMRQCVVKQFQPSRELQPAQLKMAQELFEREAEALEDLGNRHPQIPNLFAFFELHVPGSTSSKAADYFYLVQEFIDGQNMEELLAQQGPFAEDQVMDLLAEVLNILCFVHDNDAIHRDIKPSNIMRSRNGRVYLLDFGAVKQITVGQGVALGSQQSTGIYSMGFAPPEQMQGDTVYPATDLYALGVTAITLLTGKDPGDLYDSYSNTWNWRSYATVSDRLEAVLNRLLRSTPSERFQSAQDVLTALGRSPKGSWAAASPSSKGTRTAPRVTPGPNPSTALQGRASASPSPVTTPPMMPPPMMPPPIVPPPIAPPPSGVPIPQSIGTKSAPLAGPPSPGRQSAAVPPAAPQPVPLAPTPVPRGSRRSLPALPLLKGSLFTGFFTALLAIILLSVFQPPSLIGLALTVVGFMAIGGLQMVGIVGGSDLPIFAGLGLGTALIYDLFWGEFHILTLLPSGISSMVAILLFPVMAGLAMTACAIVFLLIYRILSRLS